MDRTDASVVHKFFIGNVLSNCPFLIIIISISSINRGARIYTRTLVSPLRRKQLPSTLSDYRPINPELPWFSK